MGPRAAIARPLEPSPAPVHDGRVYRESAKLGRRLGVHRLGAGSGASWLVAAVLGVAALPGFGYLAAHMKSLRLGIGALVMGAFGIYAFAEWRRLRGIEVALHEDGIAYRATGAAEPVELRFVDLVALEARYVRGALGRGAADEGNRVLLVARSAAGQSIELPKELQGFRELCETLEKRSGAPVSRTVIANLMQR